jgi:hypothetical protein
MASPCPSCGNPVDIATAVFCPTCGSMFSPVVFNQTFCSGGGVAQQSAAPRHVYATQGRMGETFVGLLARLIKAFVFVVILFVCIGIGGCSFAWGLSCFVDFNQIAERHQEIERKKIETRNLQLRREIIEKKMQSAELGITTDGE